MSETEQVATPKQQPSKHELRNAIFASKSDSKIVKFNGVELELRSPSIGALVDLQQDKVDMKESVAGMVVRCVYVPGTDERVFDAADIDLLMTLPANKDWKDLQDAMTELMGGDLEQAKKSTK